MVVLTPVEPTDLRPIRDIVYESLRAAVMKAQLAPGDRLVETQLAEQLGVSRTPVREALRMLEQDGLVVTAPRRGTIVAGLRKEDAIEIYELRAVLEGLGARLAANNVTARELKQLRNRLEKMQPQPGPNAGYLRAHAEFNEILIGASRSKRVAQLIDTFAGQLRSLRGVSLSTRERQEQAWNEHVAIVDALESRDSQRAEELARQHVENAKWAYLEQWK